jgi:DNA repair protein RecO (recombination protein O)
MRLSQVTPAIVLRARPYGESDKIVLFFTEQFGKLTGIAKGAMRSRRRFVNSLEPFSLVNLRFQDRPHTNLAFIVASDLMFGFRQLPTSLERISYASYFVEITEGLIGEREENPLVYQHLRDGLRYVEEYGTSLRFLTAFELKLLRLAGYQPVLDGCKRCGKERKSEAMIRWHFSPADGGILCDSCVNLRRDVMSLGSTAVEVLTALQAESQDLADRMVLPFSVIKEIRSVALRFIQYHMDREIKSAAFLYQFSSMPSVAP